MANLKELRNRIGSVKNTRKITAAMSQIASARLRKAQEAVIAAKPYGDRMREVVDSLVAGIETSERASAHPLLAQRKVARELMIVLTADRGLCGGFNSNVTRAALSWIDERRRAGIEVAVVAIGKKEMPGLRNAKVQLRATHEAPTLATLVSLSKLIIGDAIDAFTTEDRALRFDSVRLFYNEFVSVLAQKVHNDPLLPLGAPEAPAGAREPTYEPNRAVILEHLVALAVEARLQQAMFNSIAAEIAARRVAMDAATDNATDMISELTLQYNRERQAAITKELMEIVGGAEALKG